MTEQPGLADFDGLVTSVAPLEQATVRGAVAGGWILTQLDLAAGQAGQRITGGDALIVAINNLVFHSGLAPGEEFAVNGRLVRRGNTSFNLNVSAVADPDQTCRLVVSAEMVLVAVDAAGKPRKLTDHV